MQTILKMNKLIALILLITFVTLEIQAQDTFSIVAVDTITGEVGSAGASCVNLFQTNFSDDSFLGELFPNVGAINSQAYYIPTNQVSARNRMNMGDTPSQIIEWLVENDVQSQPQLRQYGIVAMVNGSPEAAAHTGSSTDNYKNHITGPNYSIQGNILLGQEVLDSMESRFLNESGDLACKLMAALQGANIVGADSRCASNGTSSLFAFVKVAQPTDTFGDPSFKVSVRTQSNAGIEPIDSLQSKFDSEHICSVLNLNETQEFSNFFSVFPNPSSDFLTIQNKTESKFQIYIYDISGNLIVTQYLQKEMTLDISEYTAGAYFLKLVNEQGSLSKKIIIE